MSGSHDISRRHFITATAMGSAALLLNGFGKAFANPTAGAAGVPAVTSEEALKRLKEGNARFVGGKATCPHVNKDRLIETARGGQHPFVTIIGCSDSRVPVEEVFDQGIGDIFTIRVAGNVVHTDETGSAEYAAIHLATPLIVVLGHTKCGAVTAVVKGDKVEANIAKLVQSIGPAAERAKAKKLTGDALISDAILENIKESVNLLVADADLKALIGAGKLKVVGALYDIETGIVKWL